MWGLYRLWVPPTFKLAFGVGSSKVVYHQIPIPLTPEFCWHFYQCMDDVLFQPKPLTWVETQIDRHPRSCIENLK